MLSEQESEPAMPVTPPGRTRLAFRSSDGEDEGSTEDGDEVEEAGEPAAPGVAPPEPPATRG